MNLRNSLCAANSCITTAGGLRVALQAGAVAANVAVSNPTPWVGLGTGGAVNMPSQAAHFLLSGPSSRLSLTR
jgi:hypothetical protein